MPGTGSGRTRDERGVTYLMLMFAIVLIGISTTAAEQVLDHVAEHMVL